MEDCFPFVSFSNPKEVVGVTQIKAGEEFRSYYLLESFVNEWQGVLVFNCNIVDASVINY